MSHAVLTVKSHRDPFGYVQGGGGLLEAPLTLPSPASANLEGWMDEVCWSLKLRDKNGTTSLRHLLSSAHHS